jgi:hypothetical protein
LPASLYEKFIHRKGAKGTKSIICHKIGKTDFVRFLLWGGGHGAHAGMKTMNGFSLAVSSANEKILFFASFAALR